MSVSCHPPPAGHQHVEMSHCTRITDIGLRALTIKSPNLQTLHMDGLTRIQGAGMGALAASCSTLTSLSLASCGQFEDWTYLAVAHGSPHLRHLNLNNCPKVSDEALKVWSQHCLPDCLCSSASPACCGGSRVHPANRPGMTAVSTALVQLRVVTSDCGRCVACVAVCVVGAELCEGLPEAAYAAPVGVQAGVRRRLAADQ